MDFKKFTHDAQTALNRVVQVAEEKLGKSDKTGFDPQIDSLLARADKTEEFTRKMLSGVESYLQPNPTVRMEEFFYDKLELRKDQARQNNLEWFGQALTEAGNEFGPGTPYGSTLIKIGGTQYKLGAAERELVQASATSTLAPIKRFLDNDMKTIQKERKVLENKRIDLDANKQKLKKAKTLETQAHAEADLRVAQSEFDKQAEILKLLLEGIQTAYNSHMRCMRDFVEAQVNFYAQAHQHMMDLQRELAGASNSSDGVDLYPSSQ